MIYNEKIKNLFLSETISPAVYRSIFTKLFPIESELQQDFYEMDFETQKNAVCSISNVCARTNTSLLSRLRAYQQWCIDHGYATPNEPPFKSIALRDITNDTIIKYCLFKDPQEFEDTLNMFLASPELNTIDNMYRVYLWLLYNGLTQSQAIELVKDSVHLERGVIIIDDREFSLLPQTIYYLKVVLDMKEMAAQYNRLFPLDESMNTVIRTHKKASNRRTSFNMQILKKAKKYLEAGIINKSITINNVIQSGRMWHIAIHEPMNNLELKALIKKMLERNDYSAQALENKVPLIISEYAAWKRVFDQQPVT